MDRRSFLGTVAGGVALGGTAFASEPGDEILGLLDRLTAQRHRAERDARAAFDADSVGLGWYPRSAGAMAVVDALATVPIEDQAHPAMQTYMAEVFATIGEGIEEAFGMFTELAEGDHAADPERVASALAEVQAAFGSARVSDASRRLVGNGLDALGVRLRQDGLGGEARRAVRRLSRLRRIARRVVDDPRGTSVLAPADPSFHLRIAAGTARWGFVAGRTFNYLEVLGLIGCGLGILAGTYVFVVSVACALACDAPGLLLISLVGGLVVVLCIYGIVALNRYRLHTSELYPQRYAETVDVEEEPPGPDVRGARATVPADRGFTTVQGFVLDPAYGYAVLASGSIVLGPEGLRLDPAGDPRVDGSEGDLLPGEPIGALIARAGKGVFLIGATALIPKGLSGPLELAVNGPVGARPGASGAFEVHVERLAD